MPFYEYECRSCKFHVEEMQKISDPPLVKCPSCGKRTLQKLVSAPVFRLKGSGWYETDFKSDKEGQRNLADREESKPAEEPKADKADKGDKSDKADAKPATEASAKPAEPKTPSVTTSAGSSSAAGSRHRSAAAQKRPAAPKPGARTSSARSKAKPAARSRTPKRGPKKR